MDRKIRVAAIGDNCIDYYDSLNESYPGGNPVNVLYFTEEFCRRYYWSCKIINDIYKERD